MEQLPRPTFTFLSAGPRTGEARHRTLRATLDWSYQLLSAAEEAVFQRLAVFRGGWTLDAAEQVCRSRDLEAGEVVDLLFRLVDRSLVVPDPDTGRFRLLVTIRDYGWTKLREAGEADAVQARHLEYFIAFADEHGSLTRSGGSGSIRMREEHDNLRAALDYAMDRARRSARPDDVDAGFRLANAMRWFWGWNLRYEGVAALTALLALPGGSPTCRALALQGFALFHVHYPTPESRAAARESLALLERIGDTQEAAMSRLVIAWEGQFGGDFQESWAMVRQAEEDLDQDADPGVPLMLHYIKALLHLGQGAFDASIANGSSGSNRPAKSSTGSCGGRCSRTWASRFGRRDEGARRSTPCAAGRLSTSKVAPSTASPALVHLGHTLLSSGDQTEARELLDRGNEVARRVQNPRCQAWAAWGRGRLAFAEGRPDLAVEECRRATALLQNREFPWALVQLWEFHAETATAAGRLEVADEARAAARQVMITNN